MGNKIMIDNQSIRKSPGIVIIGGGSINVDQMKAVLLNARLDATVSFYRDEEFRKEELKAAVESITYKREEQSRSVRNFQNYKETYNDKHKPFRRF